MSQGATPFVLCNGLVRIYKVGDLETVALQGLDLEVRQHEMLAVVGNSGSGKTTLLNILGGLDRPSAGRVQVGDRNLLEFSDRELARYRREVVGFVWQQSSRNLLPYLSSLENVEVPMVTAGRGPRERRARALELLEAVGLSARRHHQPGELSGGEQQRVAIAVALANRPELLLADEPTGEVDTETASGLYALLRDLNRTCGLTVIIVSHDRMIAHHVDRVVAVRDGKVSTETVRRQEVAHDGQSPRAELEELVVLDSAGRLQIPRELLDRLGGRDRVRVEWAGDHIAIRTTDDRRPTTDDRRPTTDDRTDDWTAGDKR